MTNPTSRSLYAIAATAALLAVPALSSALPVADYTVPAARDTEPVILTGKDFADWGARSNVTAKAPLMDLVQSGDGHNSYAPPEVDSQAAAPQGGLDVDRLLAYRWENGRFVEIPFQVDEMFTRYLDNSASGFAFYSGQDQHTSYAFDREGFRYWEQADGDPCTAVAAGGVETTPDPVQGLDDNDELVFMASDARGPAPADAPRPAGVEELRQVRITDPTDPAAVRVVYVAKAAADGPGASYNRDNGYVRYERDANADLFEKSESSYDNYGNARRGTVCDAEGNIVATNERRRPRDYATVTTDRYRFRYDGRWLMTDIRISPDGGETFGPDLVDRWKARAFQQDPSSETPCCGYEEEDTNWGGSSTLLGERSGPVRTIRETWGADSGTNVIRRETFYRDEVRQKNFLRVHVIPPLDGIYAQWDFNAGRMTRFHNSAMAQTKPEGVAVDGQNDEVFGNLDDPCNENYDANSTSDHDQRYRTLYSALPGLCTQFPYHQSIDLPDPTMSEPNAGMQWHVTAGEHGSIVDRYQIDELTEQSAGGTAQSAFAVPYYRDDSCFDDGTGTNPGPKVKLRSGDEPRTYTAEDGSTQPRKCWAPGDSTEEHPRFFQGSIGTHGLHILLIADSDNARQTVPVTEMVAEQRMVMLPGQHGSRAGEQYGRGFEKPLLATALPTRHTEATDDGGGGGDGEPASQQDGGGSDPPASDGGAPDREPGTPTESERPRQGSAPSPSATTATTSFPSKRVRVTRRGVALVRVKCSGPAGSRCAGRVVLARRVDRGRRVQRLGSARVSLPAGASRLVKVRLNRAARASIRRRGAINARALLLARSGESPRAQRRVKLRLLKRSS